MKSLCIALVLVSTLTAQDKKPTQALKGGLVEVSIKWEGKRPVIKPFQVPQDYVRTFPNDGSYCQKCVKEGKLKNETLEIDKAGGVKNVAISFPKIKARQPGMKQAVVDNVNCRFVPHVQFVPVGMQVRLKNTDDLSHNAKISRRGSPLANRLIPPKGESSTPKVPRPGIYTVTCDIHPWMKAWLIGTRNPHCAVTGTSGSARIPSLPAGDDLLMVAWHETMGTCKKKIAMKAGQTLKIQLTQKDFKP